MRTSDLALPSYMNRMCRFGMAIFVSNLSSLRIPALENFEHDAFITPILSIGFDKQTDSEGGCGDRRWNLASQ